MDIAIRMGRGDWPGLHATCLVREKLIPVCAPQLAARIRTGADLGKTSLLHVTRAEEDWAAWSALAGVDISHITGGLRFDTIQMAIEAAVDGLGVVLGRLPLVEQDLAANRLTQVLGPPRFCSTGYWLVMQRETILRPEVNAFRSWINGELKSSGADTANNDGRATPLRALA